MEKLDSINEVRQVEEKIVSAAKKKRKRRIRRRLKSMIVVCAFIALGIFYLMSDMSHVKSLTVIGNHVYTDAMILEKAHLNYESNFVLTSSWWTERQLKKDELIEDVKISKNLQGGLEIDVTEKMVIGYLQEDIHSLLIQGQGLIQLKEMDESLIRNIPRISGLNKEEMVKLDEAFEKVESEYVHMISEIVPFATSYDSQMVQLVMLDGNRVNTTYRGIELINNYKDILAQLEGTHVCLYVDEFSGNIIKENGDCSNASKAEETPTNAEETAINSENDEIVSENEAE